MTPVGSTDNIKTNYGEMNVQLLEANNQTPVSIAQAGVKAPWKAGGLITVPINPTKQ